MRKNAPLVSIANFLLPGLGYILLSKRTQFCVLLLVGAIVGAVYSFGFEPDTPWDTASWIGFAGGIITLFAFAYDAHTLAKED